MKVVFLSNYFNHHQKSISDYLRKKCIKYNFISTTQMRTERKELGYKVGDDPSYVIENNEKNEDKIKELLKNTDVIIYGAALVNRNALKRMKEKLVFVYSERPLKKKDNIIKYIPYYILLHKRVSFFKRKYLLSASAFAPYDYSRYFMYNDSSYKWGYFPETKIYNLENLMNNKKKNSILWCGRFLDWKHPDDVIKVAKKLKEDGFDFEINIIGSGALENDLHRLIEEFKVEDKVKILGAMSPDRVREYMDSASIYLFTSDRKEGWGAVLNESMNSGCAVVASHQIGSVPYLIKNGKNGKIYKSGDTEMLYQNVKELLENEDMQNKLGIEAYNTITKLWNAEVATERLLLLAQSILEGNDNPNLFESGPCSKAEIIKDDWFNE